ncbi:MAG: O-methyltransferase [Nitriliruptoraceae bacterium]
MEASLTTELRRLFAAEPEHTVTARRRAAAARPPDPELGALLRWAVRSIGARAVVEVGAAGGVSGAWIVPELPERGVLTSIEADPHAHGLATDAFEAMHAGARVRAILGDPERVLDRLSDGAYDLVLLQSTPALSPALLDHANRLLRTGGLLVVRQVAQGGQHAELIALGLQQLAEDERFTTVLLPLDGGLLLATAGAAPTGGSDRTSAASSSAG